MAGLGVSPQGPWLLPHDAHLHLAPPHPHPHLRPAHQESRRPPDATRGSLSSFFRAGSLACADGGYTQGLGRHLGGLAASHLASWALGHAPSPLPSPERPLFLLHLHSSTRGCL